jgi:hypothetical protein
MRASFAIGGFKRRLLAVTKIELATTTTTSADAVSSWDERIQTSIARFLDVLSFR